MSVDGSDKKGSQNNTGGSKRLFHEDQYNKVNESKQYDTEQYDTEQMSHDMSQTGQIVLPEKKKPWIPILIVLAVLAIVLTVVLIRSKNSDDGKVEDTSSTEENLKDSTGQQGKNTSEENPEVVHKPSVDGWTEDKAITVYVWGELETSIVKKEVDAFLSAHQEYVPYIQCVSLGKNLSEYNPKIEELLSNDNKENSYVFADNVSHVIKLMDDNYDKLLNLTEYGVNADTLINSYSFPKILGSDKDGNIRAVTMDASSGSVFYNREIAKKVLGTDDPDVVQEKLKDWDSFKATAKLMKESGYSMLNEIDGMFRAVVHSRSDKWIVSEGDAKRFIADSSIRQVLDLSKTFMDAGYTSDGEVFCYFSYASQVNRFRNDGEEDGKWGVVLGPTSFLWGEAYLLGVAGTKNPELCAYLMYEITTNPEIAIEMCMKTGYAPNNREANRRLIENLSFYKELNSVKLFGGQNPYVIWAEGDESLTNCPYTSYDTEIEIVIKDEINRYCAGGEGLDEAVANIERAVNLYLGFMSPN